MNLIKNKKLLYIFALFLFLNILLYFFIYFFHSLVPFSRFDYINNAHHYLSDQRIKNERQFDFLRALGQYDAQWYLKIAEKGYPFHPVNSHEANKKIMSGLTYAFFPFYPLILGFFNLFFRNIEFTAFISANLLLVLNFFSLYFVIKNIYSESIAYKTIFLLFFFPFSIFYRSYFTEGLFLFLLIWFSYFLIKKNMLVSALCLGVLNVIKANGFLFNLYFLYELTNCFKKGKISVPRFISALFFLILPFFIWMVFSFLKIGDFLYFYKIRSTYWYSENPLLTIAHNILTVLIFTQIPLHGFHYSKIEAVSVVVILLLLIKSKKILTSQLWWVSFLLYLFPLLVTDTMSFTRYQIVSFPLFIYLSHKLSGKNYYAFLLLSTAGLFTVSLFFINWYWIG